MGAEADIAVAGVRFNPANQVRYIFRTYREGPYIVEDLIES